MIKVKKIKPMFNFLVTTMETYEDDVIVGGLIDTKKLKGTLKEYQTVISVGNTVRAIKEGDLVCINPTRYAQKKHKEGSLKDGIITDNPVITYNFNVINIDGKDCLLITDQDIDYIVEDYEEIIESSSQIIHPNTDIII